MSTMTVRVLIGSVIAACLLGIAALEVVSERVRVDPSSTPVQGAPDGRPDSTPASIADLEFREEPGPSPSHQVSVSEVSRGALVVTDETQGAGLALLKPGDVIRVEAAHGQIQEIVVLRYGWQELESPAK